MVVVVTALLGTYLTLKLTQFVFGGGIGFRNIEPTFREKLLRGEPILFAVAFALSVPTVLWNSWYLNRGHARGFQLATDCYGKLRALNEIPDVRRRFDPYSVYEAVDGAARTAVITGQWLDYQPRFVSDTLADKMRLYSHRYALIARHRDSRTIQDEGDAVERCFDPKFLMNL